MYLGSTIWDVSQLAMTSKTSQIVNKLQQYTHKYNKPHIVHVHVHVHPCNTHACTCTCTCVCAAAIQNTQQVFLFFFIKGAAIATTILSFGYLPFTQVRVRVQYKTVCIGTLDRFSRNASCTCMYM